MCKRRETMTAGPVGTAGMGITEGSATARALWQSPGAFPRECWSSWSCAGSTLSSVKGDRNIRPVGTP